MARPNLAVFFDLYWLSNLFFYFCLLFYHSYRHFSFLETDNTLSKHHILKKVLDCVGIHLVRLITD